MFEIILLSYLSWRNSVRAKLKSQNPVAWAFYTVIAFFIAMIIGFYIVIFNFCKGEININQFSSMDAKTRAALQQQLETILANNPLHMVTIDLFGIGGYLLIRYLIDRKPGKKEPEIHWMDKIGGSSD